MKTDIALSMAAIAAIILLGLYFGSISGSSPVPASALQETGFSTDLIKSAIPLQLTPDTAPSLAPVQAEHSPETLFGRIAAGDTNAFKVSPAQIEDFLARNRTNAESLLAAFNLNGDQELLREAAHRYPSNAFVLVSLLGNNALPEQRRELLDQFKQIAPQNPLANYLSAGEDLKNRQPELALSELAAASAKNGFNDFTIERVQGLEELYLSAGHSPAEAKALATLGVQEPTLPALRDLAGDLSALERQYAAQGDSGSAQSIVKAGLSLAANIATAGTRSLASQMLGDSIERDFLTALDPNASYEFLSQPIGERLGQLQQERRAVVDGIQFYNDWLVTANEAQLVSYFDRMRLYGEAAALRWARTQTEQTGP